MHSNLSLSLSLLCLSACFWKAETLCGPGTHEDGGVCVADAAAPEPPVTQPTDGTPGESVPSDPQAPNILSISSNLTRMTDDDVLNIVAIVTDPDGIEDLIGGELLSPDGSSYGAFVTSAQEGAYQIALTWADLDAVETIEFEGEGSRTFGVRFYDVAGHQVDQDYVVGLYCDSDAACDGACTDLTENEDHCGQCGHTCEATTWDACQQSSCVVLADCTTERSMSCDEVCATEGLGACVESTTTWGTGVGLTSWEMQCQTQNGMLWNCNDPVRDQAEASSFQCFCLE